MGWGWGRVLGWFLGMVLEGGSGEGLGRRVLGWFWGKNFWGGKHYGMGGVWGGFGDLWDTVIWGAVGNLRAEVGGDVGCVGGARGGERGDGFRGRFGMGGLVWGVRGQIWGTGGDFIGLWDKEGK